METKSLLGDVSMHEENITNFIECFAACRETAIMVAFQIELMVAFYHQNAAAGLFTFAPREKTSMHIRLISIA